MQPSSYSLRIPEKEFSVCRSVCLWTDCPATSYSFQYRNSSTMQTCIFERTCKVVTQKVVIFNIINCRLVINSRCVQNFTLKFLSIAEIIFLWNYYFAAPGMRIIIVHITDKSNLFTYCRFVNEYECSTNPSL